MLLCFCLLLPIMLAGVNYQTHKVRKGDTLYALSRQYKVSVDEIKELNNMSGNNLSIGQVLKIKAQTVTSPAVIEPKKPAQSSVPAPQSSMNTAPQTSSTGTSPPGRNENLSEDYYYTVKAKDNLYRISLAHNIKLRDMLDWNGFVDENQLIRQGDKIIVKDPGDFVQNSGSLTEVPPTPQVQIQTQTQNQTQISSPSAEADSVLIQRVYIVQRKDTLYKIATENGMTVEELKRLNNLSSNEISVGQKLNLVTPRGMVQTQQTQPGLTEEVVRTKDKIRTDLIMPVQEYKIFSEYGIRNGRPHKGIDLGAKTGTSIYAVLDGTVVFSGYQGAYGNVIVVEHPEFVMTVYAHNEKNLVNVGDTVTRGQLIGTVGSTGNANGSHLHFEYRIKGKAINPRKVLPFDN